MDNIIYFELNNWMCGRDYPDSEPFISWFRNDLNQTLSSDTWVKENKLCVVAYPLDMSCNYLVTAAREWVLDNCPDLLSDKEYDVTFKVSSANGWEDKVEHFAFKKFLRFPDPDDDNEVYGRGDVKFLEYAEKNFGVTWLDDPYDPCADEEED